jgi:hypothetical protein
VLVVRRFLFLCDDESTCISEFLKRLQWFDSCGVESVFGWRFVKSCPSGQMSVVTLVCPNMLQYKKAKLYVTHCCYES